jgi:uncharacterized membrane protein YgaE (UPF0421/DUF939 family)
VAHRIRSAAVHSTGLAIACAASYLLTTRVINHLHQISSHDVLIGGLWAVIATAFVYRLNYEQSLTAALSRASATLLSFALCFAFLLFLPFSVWGMALLIGTGALVLLLAGRGDDVITATATTAVVMVLAAISPHDAWQQPILRLADTAVGIAMGIGVSWIGLQLARVERSVEGGGFGRLTGDATD